MPGLPADVCSLAPVVLLVLIRSHDSKMPDWCNAEQRTSTLVVWAKAGAVVLSSHKLAIIATSRLVRVKVSDVTILLFLVQVLCNNALLGALVT